MSTRTGRPELPLTLKDVGDAHRRRLDDISVVIPTLGRPILESCLASITAGDVWPACIIVVDQSSSPSVARQLAAVAERGLPTEYVPSSQRGRSAGLNRALERLQTRFVAVTDDDCLGNPDWLANMAARLRTNPDAIVSGRIEAAGQEASVAVVTSANEAVQRRPRLSFDSMSGGNMGTSRAVTERVGPFDEDPTLRLAEDCDWSYRALRLGVPIIYAPEVCIRHYSWRSEDARVDQYRAYARSHGGFYGKHIRRGDGFIALRATLHLLRAAARWSRGIVSGDRERIVRAGAYLSGLLPGIVDGFRKHA